MGNVAANLSKAGWSWICVSFGLLGVTRIDDALREDAKRLVVRG